MRCDCTACCRISPARLHEQPCKRAVCLVYVSMFGEAIPDACLSITCLQGGMMPGMGRPPMMNNYNNYSNYGNNNYGNYGMHPMMQQPQPPMYGGPGRGGMGPRGRGQPAGRMVGVCPHCNAPHSAAVIMCLRVCLLLAAVHIRLHDMFTLLLDQSYRVSVSRHPEVA